MSTYLLAVEQMLGLCRGLAGKVLDEAVALALPRALRGDQERGPHPPVPRHQGRELYTDEI